jgi:hypothetical protein
VITDGITALGPEAAARIVRTVAVHDDFAAPMILVITIALAEDIGV